MICFSDYIIFKQFYPIVCEITFDNYMLKTERRVAEDRLDHVFC